MTRTRYQSLLLIGHGYTPPARFPRCDETWTTLACVNDDRNILNIKNLHVWDCGHDIENKYNVEVYDINRHADRWRAIAFKRGHTFANQFCWMLADAAAWAASVTLFGMRMTDPEYANEIQYMAYHLGYLRAHGVGITICDPSQLLRPQLYGLKEELNVHDKA